jgi:hypothetical protein
MEHIKNDSHFLHKMASACTNVITEIDAQLERNIVDSIRKLCTDPVIQGIWSGNKIFSVQHNQIGMLQLFSYEDILPLINRGWTIDSAVSYLTRDMTYL